MTKTDESTSEHGTERTEMVDRVNIRPDEFLEGSWFQTPPLQCIEFDPKIYLHTNFWVLKTSFYHGMRFLKWANLRLISGKMTCFEALESW